MNEKRLEEIQKKREKKMIEVKARDTTQLQLVVIVAIKEFLQDLSTLKEEKDNVVEIKINKHSNIVNINCSLCKHATFWNETVLKSYKYCPWCWAKIKRVD